MGFKLGSERRKVNMPNEGRFGNHMPNKGKIIPKNDLEKGILAEANMDGSIFVNSKMNPNSEKFQKTLRHEQQHVEDMDAGRAKYGDEWVMWEDKIYLRKTIDGEKVIDGPAGRLPEGHPNHPWEKSAIEAEEGGVMTYDPQAIQEYDMETNEPSPNKFLGKLAKKMVAGPIGMLVGGKKREGGEGEAIEGEAIEPGEERSADACAECEKKGAKGKMGGLFGAGMSFKELKAKHKAGEITDEEMHQGVRDRLNPLKIGGGLIGGLFSDRRLKKNIKQVGESPSGLKIYTFKYVDELCDNNTYEGVMSDEIPASAVIKHDSGFDMVDYSQLDVEFKRI